MDNQRDRRYPIRSHEAYGFHAGTTPDGRQVLMGLFCPDLVCFFFDSAGDRLAEEGRPVAFFRGVLPPYDIYDERIIPLLHAWQGEIDFRPGTIVVKKFFSGEHFIGIEDYPSRFEGILSDPEATEDERTDVRDTMTLWDGEGQFVLLWGNDYWINSTGRVVSS